ncbi:MAG: agarase, partial [Candidatus Glassbacteria bacterium]
VNASVVAVAAEFCDVVSYNIYQLDISRFRLPVEADVPIIIGEFHMGALDRGMFHTGLVAVSSQDERAEAYKNYVRTVLDNPQFVGCHWFQFRDESTTGRPLDEENYQIGLVDIADTPYRETIQAAREIGYGMYNYRAGRK